MSISKERLILEAILRASGSYQYVGKAGAKTSYDPNNPGGYHTYWIDTAEGRRFMQMFNGSTGVAMGPSGQGSDYIYGGDGNDVLYGGNSKDSLLGKDGNDTIITGFGTEGDGADGGTGDDFIFAGDLNNQAFANIRNVVGSSTNFLTMWQNWLSGKQNWNDEQIKELFQFTTGDVSLYGNFGNDTIISGSGNDTLVGGRGNDLIYGGDGDDEIYGSYQDGDAAGVDDDDIIFGEGGDDKIYGGLGNDYLDGGDGNDEIYGGDGNDTLIGGDGNDSIYGGDGNDTLLGGSGNNRLDGGGGIDVVSYENATNGMIIDLSATTDGTLIVSHGNERDTLISIEGVIGSSHADSITGDASDNFIDGNGGADILDGGAGRDTISFASSQSGVWANLETGAARLADNTSLGTFSRFEDMEGSVFNDTLIGDAGANLIKGGLGNDELYGGAGDDTLDGGSGNNRLDGGEGFDLVDYSASGQAINVNLLSGAASGGSAAGDTLVSIERLIATNYNDTLQSGNAGSEILAGKGHDKVIAGAAPTTLTAAKAQTPCPTPIPTRASTST